MELERFVRLEWPRTEKREPVQFLSIPFGPSIPVRAVLHTFLRRSARSTLSHSTMFYMRAPQTFFEFRLRLRKRVQNTHMVAEQ